MPYAFLVDRDGNVLEVDNKYLVVKISDGTEIADIETVTSSTVPNLDEKKGLVTNAVLAARISDTIIRTMHGGYPNDGLGNSKNCLFTHSRLATFNGATWDRARSKTSDGSDINNSTVGCQIVINLNYVWDSVNEKWVPMTQP